MVVRNQEVTLRNVYFQVKSLSNNNYLLNADGGPGQVGSKLSVPNGNLPGGNQLWDKNENLLQDFRVGLMQRKSFTLVLNVYATKATATATDQSSSDEADELIDTITIELDPEAPVAPSDTLYLPLVSK